MKKLRISSPLVPLALCAIAGLFTCWGPLLLAGKDPMQALLFQEQPEVILGLALLLAGRSFLLFVAPGWLVFTLLARWFRSE